MTVDSSSLFAELFALWPDYDDQVLPRGKAIAADLGVPRLRADKWIARGYVPPWYWPRLVDVLDQRFGRIVTYRELVEATAALRGPDAKRAEAA